MTDDQDLDLGKFLLTEEDIAGAAMQPSKEQRTVDRRQKGYFTKVPWTWVKAFRRGRSIATVNLALHLLFIHFDTKHKTFKVTNQMAAEAGVSRYQKTRALTEMESWGIIMVEWRDKKNPIITLMLPPAPPARRRKKA
jgi:hypothetical protein